MVDKNLIQRGVMPNARTHDFPAYDAAITELAARAASAYCARQAVSKARTDTRDAMHCAHSERIVAIALRAARQATAGVGHE